MFPNPILLLLVLLLHSTAEPMKWNDIAQDEDFIIKALRMLQSNLQKTTTIAAPEENTTQLMTAKPRKLVDILVEGTATDIEEVSRRRVLKVLGVLEKIKTTLDKKLMLWEIFKDKRNMQDLTVYDYRQIGGLLLDIPEHDLYAINVADEEILAYMGSYEKMTRRKAAILAYAFRNRVMRSEPKILTRTLINNLRGLLCGFSSSDLAKLDPNVIAAIHNDVFSNLWACTLDQLQVLLKLSRHNFQFAHVEMWDGDVIEKLGLVLAAIEVENIKLLAPALMGRIAVPVLRRFERAQLDALTSAQLRFLSDKQMSVYNAKMFNV